MVEFTVLDPPQPLARDVECIRLTAYPANDRLSIRVCPNGRPQIVFQLGPGQPAIQSIVTDSGRVVQPPHLFVHGQITEVALMNFRGPFAAVQVVLKPYALQSLFGLDAARLANTSTTLERLCPEVATARDLDQKLAAIEQPGERSALLTGFLEGLATAGRGRDVLVEESVELISREIRTVTVELVLERLGLSERQFERRFAKAVGISPQRYIKIRRVNEAFRLMDTGEFERLSDVAYELNFYDQSHFIRDIKAYSGTTPKSISQRVNDFHHDVVGSSYLSM